MKRLATALVVLVVTASVAPMATAQSSGDAYAGTHVSFETSGQAVTDFAVHEETMLRSVKVQSQGSAEDGAIVDVGASLSAVTTIEGAGLDVGATSNTEARVEAENGATITAHDNGHGILVVESGNRSDYVVANLSTGAAASAESDSQVAVTTGDGTEATFLVVGDGNVTVNDDGDVSAHLGEGGRLVFRSYPDGKDDRDETQEQLIADGRAKAEAHVMTEGEETVVDTVSYGENTTVETTRTAEDEVAFAVDRTSHQGTILLASVSEAALNASGDLTVTVDGEAAVEAATASQLKGAVGSDRSRYMVAGGGSAEASADVLVAVNHFSERTVAMRSNDGTTDPRTTDATTRSTDAGETTGSEEADGEGTTSPGEDGDGSADGTDDSGGGVPGFTPASAVVALVAAALVARRL